MPATYLVRAICLLLVLWAGAAAWGDDRELFNRRNLDGWEVIGDGFWSVTSDGLLIGQGDSHRKQPAHQSWLYTREQFEQFDLRLVYWLRRGANSGISIRDTSRARWAAGPEWNPEKTPSHIGYEIQLINRTEPSKYDSGSIYLFAPARPPRIDPDGWNTLEIESRRERIRVRLNGAQVAEHPGEAGRPLAGPIGLQLHDKETVIMFKEIRIRPLP